MTLTLEPETRPDDQGYDEVEHLICGECFPGFTEGRVVTGLCGAPTPDVPPCPVCPPAGCNRNCLDGKTCPLCVLVVQDGIGCAVHGWWR